MSGLASAKAPRRIAAGLFKFSVFAFRLRHRFGFQLLGVAIQPYENTPGGKEYASSDQYAGRVLHQLHRILICGAEGGNESLDGDRNHWVITIATTITTMNLDRKRRTRVRNIYFASSTIRMVFSSTSLAT